MGKSTSPGETSERTCNKVKKLPEEKRIKNAGNQDQHRKQPTSKSRERAEKKEKIPAVRQGKHSVRLYAGRTRRALPGPPGPLKGEFSREKCGI